MRNCTDETAILSFLTVVPCLFLQLKFTIFRFGLYLLEQHLHFLFFIQPVSRTVGRGGNALGHSTICVRMSRPYGAVSQSIASPSGGSYLPPAYRRKTYDISLSFLPQVC